MLRSPEQLSTSTLFYLFATEWLPPDAAQSVAVPGGRVSAATGYANLVEVIVWNLVRKRMLRVVGLRPVVPTTVLAFGGDSFCRLEVQDAPAEMQGTVGGIEARVLDLVRTAERAEDNDLRAVLRRLPRSRPHPWLSITSLPYTELLEAQMVRQRGWMVKRLEIISPEKVDRARPRFEQRRAERTEHLRQHRAQHDAVIGDALAAQQWLSTRSTF
ncbi:MAG TPA: hypothetical protein VFM01_03555 [Nakamurella sp.]|nr:hypothetical protein [Nakamurella sp.]